MHKELLSITLVEYAYDCYNLSFIIHWDSYSGRYESEIVDLQSLVLSKGEIFKQKESIEVHFFFSTQQFFLKEKTGNISRWPKILIAKISGRNSVQLVINRQNRYPSSFSSVQWLFLENTWLYLAENFNSNMCHPGATSSLCFNSNSS